MTYNIYILLSQLAEEYKHFQPIKLESIKKSAN